MQPRKPGQSTSPEQPEELGIGEEIKAEIIITAWTNRFIVGLPVLLLIISIVSGYNNSPFTAFSIFGLLLSIGLATAYLYSGKSKFKKNYRQKIVNSFLRNTFREMEYEPDSYLTIHEFWQSGLCEYVPSSYEADSYIRINRPLYKLESCFIVAGKVLIDADGKSNTNLFSGLFFKYSGKFHFPTQIIVLKDSSGLSWINMNGGDDVIFNNFSKFKIDNRLFEKEYEAYTEDIDKGLAFIDVELQQFLISLKELVNTKVEISFMKDGIYVTLARDARLFEPGLILLANGSPIKRTTKDVKWLKQVFDFMHPHVERLIEKYRY